MILKGYVEQYFKSDYELVRWSKSIIEMMDQGGFTTKNAAMNKLREAVDSLNTVINRNGELKEKAEELKNRCMEYLQPLTGKKAVGG